MKKIKIEKKLNLKRDVISRLGFEKLKNVAGGYLVATNSYRSGDHCCDPCPL